MRDSSSVFDILSSLLTLNLLREQQEDSFHNLDLSHAATDSKVNTADQETFTVTGEHVAAARSANIRVAAAPLPAAKRPSSG